MEKIGSHYLNMDLVPDGSTIISVGIGRDVSFDSILIKQKNCFVVGIDPTNLSEQFINSIKDQTFQDNFKFIKKALYGDHKYPLKIGSRAWSLLAKESETFYKVDPISLSVILDQYPNPAVLKLDIEGSEYSVIDSINSLNIPQITMEFHHWLGDKESWSCGQIDNPYSFDDTLRCIKKLEDMGYKMVHQEGSPKRKIEEALFIKDDLC